VLFNPTQYTVEKSNQIAETGIPGLRAPVLQYVHGNTRTLSMELYFDTFEERTDVTSKTDKVYNLLAIVPRTHVPPICIVEWGSFKFKCVVDKVSGQFLLFLPEGTPVRAKLNVTFKEFVEVKVQVSETPNQSADHRKTRTVQEGDNLSLIAWQEYGNPELWRPIARANRISDPRSLQPGQVLSVPRIE
jgi:hypothetical protein